VDGVGRRGAEMAGRGAAPGSSMYD
jgi:hypothetical protein